MLTIFSFSTFIGNLVAMSNSCVLRYCLQLAKIYLQILHENALVASRKHRILFFFGPEKYWKTVLKYQYENPGQLTTWSHYGGKLNYVYLKVRKIVTELLHRCQLSGAP